MKKIASIFALLCITIISVFAQKFPVDTLVFNGNPDSRVNFVIIGDGYLESQQGDFLEDARKITDDLFRSSPFTEYKDYFNVFTISVPSNEEGAADDPSALIDNYFGSTFNYAGIQRLLVPTRTNHILNVMADNIPEYDQVIVVVNTTVYGGSGGQFATSSVNLAASEISIHEIGHSFAGLSDEYWAGSQYARESPNMTRQSSLDLVKWKNWVSDRSSEIRTYPHSVDPNWYKPHPNCKMQFLGAEFCAVCKEQMIQSIYRRVAHVEAFSPVEGEVSGEVIQFDLSTIKPFPNTLNITWILDEEEVGSNDTSYELNLSSLEGGSHDVKVIIYDSTALDKRDRIYITQIEWQIGTDLNSNLQRRFLDRPKDEDNVVTSVSSSVSGVILKLYPNPTSDKIQFAYEGASEGKVKVSLMTLDGKELLHKSFLMPAGGKINQTIDIAGLPSGIYLVAVDSGKLQKTFRINKK